MEILIFIIIVAVSALRRSPELRQRIKGAIEKQARDLGPKQESARPAVKTAWKPPEAQPKKQKDKRPTSDESWREPQPHNVRGRLRAADSDDRETFQLGEDRGYYPTGEDERDPWDLPKEKRPPWELK